MADGVYNYVNFRNSDCVTARVDYVESVDSVVWQTRCFLLWSKFLVELRVIVCIESTSMLTGIFCTNILYPLRKLLLYRSKEESPRLSALARYSV